MYRIHASRLDDLVSRIDALGGVGTPEIGREFYGFNVDFDTKVDESLDPFSDAYVANQVRLYEELSGRELDQSSGEMTLFDLEAHSTGPNPYNSRDVDFIARNSIAVMSMLRCANLPPNPAVLDLGCGWGLSTEMMAFCGCDVTAVDINPDFVALVKRRLSDRHLRPAIHLSNFDDVDFSAQFDLAVFYECLHHAVKPWETIAVAGKSLKPGGKIAFAGEPINTHWWKHWGLRLDIASVYCIRKFGWFESGWTQDFLALCFKRNGLSLSFYPQLGLDSSGVGIAHRVVDTASGIVRPDLPTRTETDGGANVTGSSLLMQAVRFGGRSMRAVVRLARRVKDRPGQ
jgi:2-polyprenyl-3-methyl-5-hydroxy-6-metoxy-1,4-benzoquinol methylase